MQEKYRGRHSGLLNHEPHAEVLEPTKRPDFLAGGRQLYRGGLMRCSGMADMGTLMWLPARVAKLGSCMCMGPTHRDFECWLARTDDEVLLWLAVRGTSNLESGRLLIVKHFAILI